MGSGTGSGAGLTAPTSRTGGSTGDEVKVPVYGHAGAHNAANAASTYAARGKGALPAVPHASGSASIAGMPPVLGALNAKVASFRESTVFSCFSLEGFIDQLPKNRAGQVSWFIAWTVVILVVGIYIGDYRADMNPEMNQWCMMQARECKRQADNCANGVPTVIEENGDLAAVGAGGGGGGGGGAVGGGGLATAPHLEQMHAEWTAHKDNRANTIQSLKDLRKEVICHERQVIQQRLRGAKDVDRISSFMMKLEKVQTKYDELEAVVKVVYPEVLPEVREMDQTDPKGCIKLSALRGARG